MSSGDHTFVRDVVYTSKYLHVFAQAIDREQKKMAREVFNQAVVPSMTVRMVGSKTGKPTANWSLNIVPTDLMAAAWLQMAGEMTKGDKMKKCEAPNCSDWFSYRANKKFCGNRCKMAFHKKS